MQNLDALNLYHKVYCPYCVKVRVALHHMGVEIKTVDVGMDAEARNELITQGGMSMVPCLRIVHDDGSIEWMYESDDIIDYMKKNVTA